mmetsp:Transcript_43090/g.116283  ORF Transcript_43090/g.116283 Transcript_43090/m.116283 type:complete len:125 (-) Transcript_43090:369-743(-)
MHTRPDQTRDDLPHSPTHNTHNTPTHARPHTHARVQTFGAFVAFGSVPLLSFIAFSSVEDLGPNGLFGICCLFTAIAIFALGAVKGKFAQANMFTSGAYMLLNGSLAAASSYVIGWGLETLVPE